MLTKLQRTIIFFGDFWPLFLIGLLEGIQSVYYLDIALFSILFALSILGTVYFINLLNESEQFQKITRQVKSLEDRGNIYIIYIVSYVSMIPILSFTIAGAVSFILILTIIYSLYMNSDMVFYNPLLALINYKFYKIEDSEGSEIYVISKKHIEKNESLSMYSLTDYVYLL